MRDTEYYNGQDIKPCYPDYLEERRISRGWRRFSAKVCLPIKRLYGDDPYYWFAYAVRRR